MLPVPVEEADKKSSS